MAAKLTATDLLNKMSKPQLEGLIFKLAHSGQSGKKDKERLKLAILVLKERFGGS